MFAVVFAETGLVALVFLPGDSLLVAAGVLASHGILQIMIAILVVFTAAVLGDAVNFYVGRHFGTKAVRSALVKREHVARTEWYFERYGGKTVVLARFIPVVRTVAPFVAGVASMPYRDFGIYNVVGAALWAAVCVGGGYLFGGLPFFREHYGLIMFALVAVSLAPLVVHAVRARHGGHRRNQLRLTGPGLLHPGTGVFSPNWRSQDKV